MGGAEGVGFAGIRSGQWGFGEGKGTVREGKGSVYQEVRSEI